MTVSKDLLALLVCPESKRPLLYFEEEQVLFCPDSRLKYRIQDGIPVMLVEEADRLDETEASALMEKAQRLGLTTTSPDPKTNEES